MRIAIDAHTLSGPPQGVKTYVENISKRLSHLESDLELVMLTGHGYRPDKGWGANVRFETWPGGRLRRLSSGARDVMRKLGCSAFHCSYFLPVVAMPNPMVTIHDVLPQTHPHLFTRRFVLACKHWFRFSVKRAQHVFTPSEYARESLIDFYGIAENKVSVTPCAVDFDFFFSGLGRDPSIVEPRLRKENYFLVVGRFDPRKDHATIVEAYSRLHARRRDVPMLVIAGSYGPTADAILIRVAELKLQDKILMLRNVAKEHLPVLYANALASISASQGEGFGLPMVEAMAAGSPVICADNTAQTEVVKGHGLMFQTADADELAHEMEHMMDDTALRAELRLKGFARARYYNWDVGAEEFLRQTRRLHRC